MKNSLISLNHPFIISGAKPSETGHGREGNIHPKRLGFPLSEQDAPDPFTHRPQTPQHSFQGAAAGTHATPAPNRAHSGLHGETRGVLDGGWYHYPRSVLRGSETLRGRDLKRQTLPLLGLGRECSRRTQKACGTAMRSCASLFRGVAAPLGCVIPLFFSLTTLMSFTVLLNRFVGTQKIERLFFSYSGAFLEQKA